MINRKNQVLAAIGFMLLLLMQHYATTVQHIQYLVNRSAYEVRCENKANPKLKCHGKCQLKKQQQATEQQQQSESIPEKRDSIVTAFFLPITWQDFRLSPTCRLLSTNKSTTITSSDCRGYLMDIFHPPSV